MIRKQLSTSDRLGLRRWRAWLGIAFVTAMSLYALWNVSQYYGLFEYVRNISARGFLRSQSIVRYEENFACLKVVLDPSEPVGFITRGPSSLSIEYFQLAQYTLAPVLLELKAGHRLVVGYFPSPGDREAILDEHPELDVLLECGDEVALLVRSP